MNMRPGALLRTDRDRYYRGYSRPDNIEFFDDFLGDLIEDGWNVAADTGGTANCGVAASGGVCTITNDTSDNDVTSIAHELNWYPNKSCYFETRLKIDVVTTLGFCVGFSDAKSEAGSTLPWELSVVTYTTTGTDGFGFLFDVDATTDTIRCVGVKTDVDGTHLDSAIVPVAGTYITLACGITPGETASYWIDNVLIGTVALASAAAVALTPYIGIKNQGGAAHVASIDYVYCAQSRT